tara:strand:+ start:71 stop:436 length:366 start_codon:yes stop_codon:yes gene_type:complete
MTISLNVDGNNPNQLQEYQIEGVTYFINTLYNVRSGWYMSFFNKSNTLLLGGVKCVASGLLTHRYSRSTGLFTGDIRIMDTAPVENDNAITKDNFGQGRRYQPWYFTKDEMDLYQFSPYQV